MRQPTRILLACLLATSLTARADEGAPTAAEESGSAAAPAETPAPAEAAPKSETPPPAPAPAPAPAAAPAPVAATKVETIEAKPVANAAPEAAPAAPAATPDDDVEGDPGHSTLATFRYELHGFVRAGYTYVDRDPGSFTVGQNSGFRLYNSRLNVVGGYGDLIVYDISLDLDEPLTLDNNQAAIRPAMRDANIGLKLGGLTLTAGQFKTPYNGEFLLSDGDVPFARRSLLSEGIRGDEGRSTWRFMGLDRQVGAMASYLLPAGPAALKLEFAAVNGNGINQGRNDNAAVAFVGRFSVGLFGSNLGVGGYINDRTVGQLANLTDERDLALDVDLLINILGVKLFGAFLLQRTEFLTVAGAPARLALGVTGSLSRAFDLGSVVIEPAVRGAYFEPSNEVVDAGLIDVTAGLNIYPFDLPFRLQANYTARIEKLSRTAPNNLLEVVLQSNF